MASLDTFLRGGGGFSAAALSEWARNAKEQQTADVALSATDGKVRRQPLLSRPRRALEGGHSQCTTGNAVFIYDV